MKDMKDMKASIGTLHAFMRLHGSLWCWLSSGTALHIIGATGAARAAIFLHVANVVP